MWRDHRQALVVTFRRYGLSAWEIGTKVSWAEACDLLDAALQDTGTEIFAATAGWQFPLSRAEMLLVIAAYGKQAMKVMPFTGHGEEQPTEVEVAQAHAELLNEIQFS